LHSFLRDCQSAAPADLPRLRARLWEESSSGRVPYVVGAVMARAIEETAGTAALVRTIVAGPESFVAAFEKSRSSG